MENQLERNKERFKALIRSTETRKDELERLLGWLEGQDFFEAPASTRFHGAYKGGLLEHSLNVYDAFIKLFGNSEHNKDSIIICTLLHDVCKVGFYSVEYRNKKNEAGVWEKVPVYVVDDKLPYGHGEKSVYILNCFMRLKTEEAMAIRWHMGGFDEAVKGGSYAQSSAFGQFPLAVKVHMADLYASYIMETRDEVDKEKSSERKQVEQFKVDVLSIPVSKS